MATIIYDSNDSLTMGEVRDVVRDDNTTVIDDETSDDNEETSEDNNKTVDACAARDIMNRVRREVGTAAREDRRFLEHFGAPFAILQIMWDMMEEGGLLPKKGNSKHLL